MISPLLSNVYLHPFDLYWEREVKATKMVRYADDLVGLCRWKPPGDLHAEAEAVPGAATGDCR